VIRSQRLDATSVHTTLCTLQSRTWHFLGFDWALLASCYLQLVFRKPSCLYSDPAGSLAMRYSRLMAISLGETADTTQVGNDQATLQYSPSRAIMLSLG
jgi:hypothetical protein